MQEAADLVNILQAQATLDAVVLEVAATDEA
jgi:hypothetical protein